jgi:hypothetical protein
MKTNQGKVSQKIWPACTILGLILVFFGKNIFPVNGNFIGGIDVANYFLWHAQFIKGQLLSGSIPLWNPYYYSGHPFIANPQTFVFYPATLLFAALPLAWAFNIDTLLHVYLAAMGMYCFVFVITESKRAGLASAVVYSLGGYFMDNIFAGHLTMIHTAALLPWIFYFFEKGYKTERIRFFLIAGLVFGLQILSGEPQNNYYTALFLMVYFLLRYFLTPRSERPKPWYRQGTFLALILLVAMGISAVQILPSLEFLSLSDRAKNTYRFATFGSFPPQNFFTFLVPKIETPLLPMFWEFSGYLGIFSVILAGIGAGFSKHRRHVWCFMVILFIAVTIMLGSYTPIYYLYYKWLPGISTFRIPARCLVIFVFSMALFVGFGIQHICESAITRKQYIAAMVWSAILFLWLFVGAKVFQIPFVSKEMVIAVAFFVIAFVILNLNRFLKNKSITAGLIIAALFIELYLIYFPQIPIINQNNVLQKQPYELLLKQDTGFYRVASVLPLHGADYHYYGVNGYTTIMLDSYFWFMHETANLPMLKDTRHKLNPQLFRRDLVFSSKVLGIKYALIETGGKYEMIVSENTQKITPRALLVKDAIVLPQLEEHLLRIKRPDFDPQRQVLFESLPNKSAQLFPKTAEVLPGENNVTITRYQPNRIELTAVSDSSTYLVLSELFYPGWYAYVDSNKVEILRADYLLRAIPLAGGRHNVVFVYRPASFITGATLTIFTLLIIGCVCLFCYRKNRIKTQIPT